MPTSRRTSHDRPSLVPRGSGRHRGHADPIAGDHVMSHEYSPPMLRTVYDRVPRCHRIEVRASVSVWAPAPVLATYTTWQLQQWRRCARLMALATDREGEIHLDAMMVVSADLLASRGAWCPRRGVATGR